MTRLELRYRVDVGVYDLGDAWRHACHGRGHQPERREYGYCVLFPNAPFMRSELSLLTGKVRQRDAPGRPLMVAVIHHACSVSVGRERAPLLPHGASQRTLVRAVVQAQ